MQDPTTGERKGKSGHSVAQPPQRAAATPLGVSQNVEANRSTRRSFRFRLRLRLGFHDQDVHQIFFREALRLYE